MQKSNYLMKKLLIILFLGLLWCTNSYALLDPPIKSYLSDMKKDEWIKYRIFNRCSGLFLYQSISVDYGESNQGKDNLAHALTLSDAYSGLGAHLHKKLLNLEDTNLKRQIERKNYWKDYYLKSRYLAELIASDTETCFEISDYDDYKKFFNDFLKTFIGYYREKVGWIKE